MDYQAYKALEDVYRVVNNEKGIMSSSDIAYVSGVLKTMLTLYADATPATTSPPAGALDGLGSARQAPVRGKEKQKWYQKLLG